MTEAEREIKRGCTSMKILFSAAMNFKMINKTRRIDSRGSSAYSRGRPSYKQADGTVKTGEGARESSVSMCNRKTDSITKPKGMT